MTSTAKPWIAHYSPDSRWDAELPRFAVHEMLFDTVARFGPRPALDFLGRTISYDELGQLVRRAAAGFQKLGVKPGVHVGLYLPNTPHYFIAFYGVLAAGGTIVNYSPLDAARVLAHKIEDSQTDILVTLNLTVLYPQMGALLGASRLKTLVVGAFGDYSASPAAVEADMRGKGLWCDVPVDDRHLSFDALLDNDGSYVSHPMGALDKTLAALQYTGGTTGLPKGAMLTHANMSTACSQVIEASRGEPPVLVPGEERMLVILPLFHIFALVAAVLFGTRLGAHMFLHARFDATEALRALAKHRITMLSGVPTMFTAIVNHPEVSTTDLSALKYAGSGGAPIPEEVSRRFEAITGTIATDGWGMTETTALGTLSPFKGPVKYGSCGMPASNIDIRFVSVDDPAVAVPYGERGEICIKGPNVMVGYWNQPDATRDAFTADGYFRTGDVGVMDEEGYVRIVDRTKDMLLCSGYNVYPRVIEEAIYQHPSVEEACVIGVPDEYRGQSPKAFVKLRAGAPELTLDELKLFLKDRIGKHEMVQALELRDGLPKTPVGKLSKRELVEEEARKRGV